MKYSERKIFNLLTNPLKIETQSVLVCLFAYGILLEGLIVAKGLSNDLNIEFQLTGAIEQLPPLKATS